MSFTIVIDPGHGGWDNGASYMGRLEKDDNLRLGLEVVRYLREMGQTVVMTRSEDVYPTLTQRARIANEAGADVFISLHRNSSEVQTPGAKGVENWIYTAATPTAEAYAKIVLDRVVEVGVQRDGGVKRANFLVLRETQMPAMLLEMGFINNEEDNRLFDQNLSRYAEAIARGAIEALTKYAPGGEPNTSIVIRQMQQMLNRRFNGQLTVDGVYGQQTKRALARAVQITLNRMFGLNLMVDGIIGPQTAAHIPPLRLSSRGDLVMLLQYALYANGYDPGKIDGVFGAKTASAVKGFQLSRGLTPDGVAGGNTFSALFA